MRERSGACLDKKLEQMSVEQMDALLQAELQKEKPEEGVVLPILKELEKREEGHPTEVTQSISAAWDKVQRNALHPENHRKRRSWVTGAVAAAAALCVVILFVPQTVGAESIFDVLVRWTEDVFSFVDPEKEQELPQTDVFSTDNADLQRVYDKITELGVAKPVVPMWIPEGFVLDELKVTPLPNGGKIYVTFLRGGHSLVLSYRIFADTMPLQHEKKETSIEVVEVAGVDHYVLVNEGTLSVTWIAGNTECAISTDIERDELYKIINSIYRRELS